MDEMPDRKVGTYQLDANRINALQKDSRVNQLEKWHKSGVIFLEMSRVAYDEAGNGSIARGMKADEYTWISANDSLGGEKQIRHSIEQILFPGGAKNENEQNDVLILFAALRSGATLVTEDGQSRTQPKGILGNAECLAKLGVRVLRTQTAIEEVELLLAERDEIARRVATCRGTPLPEWVGKDSL